jgi:MYXO-CTERM domain-containing protein
MRPLRFLRSTSLLALLAAATSARADSGTLPDNTYAPDKLYQLVSPPMGAVKHNQPSIVNGYLMLAGNAKHELWDIHNPVQPELVSTFEGPYHEKEAESHTVAFARRGDSHYSVTISGKGVDFWDLTDAETPVLLSTMLLEGIDYGDNTNAVWGVFWQGKYVYVGGTNTGLHVVDASDPASPALVTRLPTAELGGVSAGPLFAIGNLLVITTPKEHAGIATVDIGDPASPSLLDFVLPVEKSYIGGFYGGLAYLITPFRAYDVTTDPASIALAGETPSPKSEYMSFGDGFLFLGGLRPNPGVFKFDLSDPTKPVEIAKIEGRKDKLGGAFTDDQFPLPVGNLLVMSDDEVSIGSVIAVHDTQQDSRPPAVLYVNPKDGATAQPLTTRVGLAFSDQIDLRTVDPSTLVVRPIGGAPLAGSWGHMQTLVSFWPDEPLLPNTTYEIALPQGGIRDLAGNPIAQDFTSVFSTGTEVSAPKCKIATPAHTPVGTAALLTADGAPDGATFTWSFGDDQSAGPLPLPSTTHEYDTPGRYPVKLTVQAEGVSRTCTALQVVHRPLAPEPPARSSTVVHDDAAQRAWVVSPDDDSVAIIDTGALVMTARVEVGDEPRTLAAAPDGSIWVACRGSDEVVVLDGDGAKITSVPLPWGSAPFGVAFSPGGTAAWVSLEARGAVAEIDPATHAVRRTIALGGAPRVRSLAITTDRILIPRFLSPADHGEVHEISTDDGALTRTFALAADPGPDETTKGRGIPNALGALAVSPDGARAFVPAKKDNTGRGLARDGEELNTDNTVRTIVASLDLGTGAEDMALRKDLDNHDMASAVAWSPVGDLVFVASQGTNHVDVLDAYTGKLVAGFSTGQAPQGLALSEDGRLFVQSFLSRTLDVYDVTGLLAGTDASVPFVAGVPTIAEEPLSPEVLLGKQIFHNASDPRMSLDGYLSCATCHPDGGDDARVWDFTDRGEGLRNTTSLEGRAGMAHGPVHWTGNFDEIQDFEGDIRHRFGGGGFLSDADFEAEQRSEPLGTPKAGVSAPLDALAAYVATLDRLPRSPHRAPDGALTPEAEAGRALFLTLDCLDCHSGQPLTDSALGRRHDVGTLRPTSGQRLGQPLDGLDTPTLRGLWATAPYLHDGSAATLHDVLLNPRHGDAALLPEGDREKLVQFLLQLENEELDLTRPSAAAEGCSCRAAGGGAPAPGWPALLLALLGWRRKRRQNTA